MKKNISNFLTKWVLNPVKTVIAKPIGMWKVYQKKRRVKAEKVLAERIEAQELADLKANFTKNFHITPEKMVKLMETLETNSMFYPDAQKLTPEEYQNLLREDLKRSAKLTLGEVSPLFYNPEINNIHNEFLEDNSGMDLGTVIFTESNKAQESLDSQLKLYEVIGRPRMKEVNRVKLESNPISSDSNTTYNRLFITPRTTYTDPEVKQFMRAVKKKFGELTKLD